MPTALAVRCSLCSRTPRRWRRSSTGATYCAHHPWCEHCRTAHLRLPCAEQLLVVRSGQDAERRTAQVLQDLATVGLLLPRVPLTLLPTLPGPELGRCLTREVTSGATTTRSARVEIRVGLGPTRFGHVVAHEHAHALVHLNGGPRLDPTLEEGFCELVAVVWLTGGSVPGEILRTLWCNPDPVYGLSMRRLVGLARRDGVGTVVHRVLSTGQPE